MKLYCMELYLIPVLLNIEEIVSFVNTLLSVRKHDVAAENPIDFVYHREYNLCHFKQYENSMT